MLTVDYEGGLAVYYVRGRLQRTSGKWGGGVVLKFHTFSDGGRGWFDSSEFGRPKISEKIEIPKFLRAL